MQNELQPHRAGTTCFSWVPKEFPPAYLVAFQPEKLGKSVHWACLQVRPNQKVLHNAYWNVNHKLLLVAGNRCNMKVCFCPNMAVTAVENPSQMKQALSMNNTIVGNLASPYCRAQVIRQIGLDKGNRWGLEPAPSANGKDRTVACLQRST